jgi:mono/diheme cytochrome c family protein
MTNGLALLVTAGFLAASGAILRAPAGPDPAAAAQGKIIYARYCASCHGAEGRGDGPVAADLKVRPANLQTLATKNGGSFPFEKVTRAIDGRQKTRGHSTPDMPVWAEVFPKTAGTDSPSVESAVGRIAHYLWSIQRTAETLPK